MPTVVRCRSVVCLLGGFPALAGLDLDVDAGEVVLLSGPNGAGKTTLLRMLAGLVPVVRGEVVVLGADLRTDRRRHRHLVGFVGHDPGAYDDLTVRENLRLWARLRGRAATCADETLGWAGLGPCADMPAARLSAGQRRRLALAGASLVVPSLLLLDEPHAGLDDAGRALVDDLVGVTAAAGGTVLLASHERDRVRPLARREVHVAGGRAFPVREVVGAAP